MRLYRPDGCSFALSIAGYQFPQVASAQYDADWLNIAIEVQHPRGAWQAVDPALLTFEVNDLAQWLREIAAGKRATRDKTFLEPCLSFRVSGAPEQDDELVIQFSHEFAPPWARESVNTKALLAFPLCKRDLIAAALSLERLLTKYPQRANR